MLNVDPVQLARAQLARDEGRTRRFAASYPGLLPRKIARMSASPLAFLRGSSPLFYELLKAHPELVPSLPGQGWLVGDLHVENFGAYRPDESDDGPRTEFNLNDFDEAVVGPCVLDVLRLTTSLILAGRELGADGPTVLALCDGLLQAYVASAASTAEVAPLEAPAPVAQLIEKVRGRSRKELLDDRTEVVKGVRRFVRGERYLDLPEALRDQVQGAVDAYASSLPPDRKPPPETLRVLDAAFRVAGTGSLGVLRVAVLVTGKGKADGARIFDMKEEPDPAAEVVTGPGPRQGALRVVEGTRALLSHPPPLLGTATMGTASMFVRRLSPQEDKLDLRRLRKVDLPSLATYLGHLVGTAHRLGRAGPWERCWTSSDQEQVLERAVRLAGIHESTYLAWCRITR